MEYLQEMRCRQDLNIRVNFWSWRLRCWISKQGCFSSRRRRKREEEEDPRAELVEQLLEYKMYKCISNELRDRQVDAGRIFYREPFHTGGGCL